MFGFRKKKEINNTEKLRQDFFKNGIDNLEDYMIETMFIDGPEYYCGIKSEINLKKYGKIVVNNYIIVIEETCDEDFINQIEKAKKEFKKTIGTISKNYIIAFDNPPEYYKENKIHKIIFSFGKIYKPSIDNKAKRLFEKMNITQEEFNFLLDYIQNPIDYDYINGIFK